MYKHSTKMICSICQAEQHLNTFDYLADKRTCETFGWVGIARVHTNIIDHVCPSCIRVMGYAFAFNLAKVALQKFDPKTYGNVDDIAFLVGDPALSDDYFTYDSLVRLTHPEDNTCD